MLWKKWPGFVYVIDFKERGFKIGRARDLRSRVKSLTKSKIF